MADFNSSTLDHNIYVFNLFLLFLKSEEDVVEPTKEETAIGKHLRWNCPKKSSTMMGNKVEYFIGKIKNQPYFQSTFVYKEHLFC